MKLYYFDFHSWKESTDIGEESEIYLKMRHKVDILTDVNLLNSKHLT